MKGMRKGAGIMGQGGRRAGGRRFGLVLLLAALFLSAALSATASAAGVRLSVKEITLKQGKTKVLRVTGTKKKVKWSSSRASVAVVNAKGKVRAKKRGAATITAKVGGKTYRCRVTVVQPVTKVTLSRKSLKLAAGCTARLKAAVAPSNANNKKLLWSSSNRKVVRVSSSGEITAVAAGKATVTAAAADGSKKKAKCTVTVTVPFSISQTEVTMEQGAARGLGVRNTGGQNVYWGSSDPQVVTVSRGTLVGVGTGTAVVTAVMADGSQNASCKVTVIPPTSAMTVPSQKARRFLEILQQYSDQVRQDKEKGKLWGYSNSGSLIHENWAAAKEALNTKGVTYTNCALLPRVVLKQMGILHPGQNFWGMPGGGLHFGGGAASTLKEHCAIISFYDTAENLILSGKLLPGDICTWTYNFNHTNVYAGNGMFYEAGRGGDGGYMKIRDVAEQYGIDKKNLRSDNGSSGMYVFNSFGPCASMDLRTATVGQVIRIIK